MMAIPQAKVKYTGVIKNHPNDGLKKGIWLYFLLVIFEGALRKWIVPGLATPLLIIRDPIALWLIVKSIDKGLLPKNGYIFTATLIGILGTFTALVFGHGNLFVALFGARLLLLHFPLIFIIGQIMDHEDVVKIGRVLLLITIPMTLLVALQFYSPQSAWVNRGIGGDMAGGGYIGGANGFFRPPGTFSFTTGLGQFYALVGCYIFYFLLKSKEINKIILVAATVSFVFVIPLCLSRSVLFQTGISMLFALMGAIRNPKLLGATILGAIILGIVILLLGKATLFNTAFEALSVRFTQANEFEDSVGGAQQLDRYLGGIIAAFDNLKATGFWGLGLGMGSNVGSQLLAGEVTFLITETELGRWIGELGPIMGMIIILMRFNLAFRMLGAGYRRLAKGDLLAWMLLSAGFLLISEGNWAQPTSLGFCIVNGGLIVAASGMLQPEIKKVRSGTLPKPSKQLF